MSIKTAYPNTSLKTADVLIPQGTLSVGCKFADGELVPAFAEKQSRSHTFNEIKLFGFSSFLNGFIVCADNKVYFSENGLDFTVQKYSLQAESPFIFEQHENGVKQTVVVGDTTCLVFTGTIVELKNFAFKVSSGVIKNGRLFGVDRQDGFRLRWSGEGGAFDWQEDISGAGWVDLPSARGKITDIVVMDDKLVAVRERGLTVLSVYGTPENFKVQFTDTLSPTITPHTAAVVCGKLYFICDNRIFCFDGVNISPVECSLQDEINLPCFAAAYGENYLVCIDSKFLTRRVVLVKNVKDGQAYLADIPATVLCCGGGLYALTQNKACAVDTGKVFNFYSRKINFGTVRNKFLKTVEISAEKEIGLIIKGGERVRNFSSVNGRVNVNMPGEYFRFTLAVNGGKVYSVKATAEVPDGI